MKDLTTLKWMKCFDPLRTCNDDIFDSPLGGKVTFLDPIGSLVFSVLVS